jgi:hypothetical protein
MKSILNITKFSLLLGSLLTISSCDNEPEASNLSRITYFPEFAYEGGTVSLIPCNSDFEVPPVTATEGGETLPVSISTTGISGPVSEVDINKPDMYIETASAVNQDGFSAELERTFWVACTGDLVNSIEGLYTSTVSRNSPTPRYYDMEYILIRKVGTNQYEISNADGGWYQFGRALGPGYSSPGAIVTANDIPSNSFSFGPPVEVRTFGGLIQLTSMTVDPATKTIVFSSYWDFDYTFTATLTQVAL